MSDITPIYQTPSALSSSHVKNSSPSLEPPSSLPATLSAQNTSTVSTTSVLKAFYPNTPIKAPSTVSDNDIESDISSKKASKNTSKAFLIALPLIDKI